MSIISSNLWESLNLLYVDIYGIFFFWWFLVCIYVVRTDLDLFCCFLSWMGSRKCNVRFNLNLLCFSCGDVCGLGFFYFLVLKVSCPNKTETVEWMFLGQLGKLCEWFIFSFGLSFHSLLLKILLSSFPFQRLVISALYLHCSVIWCVGSWSKIVLNFKECACLLIYTVTHFFEATCSLGYNIFTLHW